MSQLMFNLSKANTMEAEAETESWFKNLEFWLKQCWNFFIQISIMVHFGLRQSYTYKLKSSKWYTGETKFLHSKAYCLTPSQDGGAGRHGSPLHTTTSKLQLKYRTFITQNCQKLSWKEVWQLWKKPHLCRLVGGMQTWNRLVTPIQDG